MNKLIPFLLVCLFVSIIFLGGCKKNESSPTSSVPTYSVTITVVNPSGQPQGGALVSLKNAPYDSPDFSSYTDTAGKASLKSPSGNQTFIAQIGSAFRTEVQFNVTTSAAQNIIPTVQLTQNTAKKVLCVQADAEQLEDVISDPKIGFTTYSLVYIDTLRDQAIADSAKLLAYLQQFTIIFSNCDGGTEGDAEYAKLSRVYGRYVSGGGHMYGGHFNYYHLQRIWTSSYQIPSNFSYPAVDSISLVDNEISKFVGFSSAYWNSTDSRNLSGYMTFSDIPSNSKIYGTIKGLNPAVDVIIENHIGSGIYLWTDYHNQDIKDDAKLIKLVQYFLYYL
jgi:hypothetical protein